MANQLIVVSGPKEGAGKTTFAVNFAMQYVLSSKKPVVILDCDTKVRGEISYYTKNTVYETVEDLSSLVSKINIENADTSLFKGRILFSDSGIGVLKLAENPASAVKLTADQIFKVLAIFNDLYTFVIDAENIGEEIRNTLYEKASYVFWVMLPEIIHLEDTIKKFQELQNLNFNMENFGIILNKSNIDEGLTLRQINPALQNFRKSVIESIPNEKLVTRASNSRQIVVVDAPHTQFAKSIRVMVDSMMNRGNVSPDASSKSIWKDIVSKVTETGASPEIGKESGAVNREEFKRDIKAQIHKKMIQELNMKKIDLNSTAGDIKKEQELRKVVEQTLNRILANIGDTGFSRQENQDIIKEILDDALGLGPLEEFLREKSITEIMVNKKDQIYVEKSGKLTLSDKKFISDDQVVQVIRRIIAPLGRRIDESVPLVDARLKDGSRVNAIIPPLAVQGPMITIRRFPDKALTDAEMINYGSINKDMVEFLRACVISEKSIIVSGGTGSGKTTLLNMLSSYIPVTERIITIEDVAELRLQQEHLGRLESRPPNIEGKGEITIRDLVKNTLRMRPDRIIVGECRGGEALDMLQAMNTGHEGSMTTIHANTPKDMISRLEAMVLMAGSELPLKVIRNYIASAINFVVQIGRLQDGTRKVTAISEVTGIDEQTMIISLKDIFLFRRTGIDKDGKVLGVHEATGNIPSCLDEFKLRGIDFHIDMFKKNG
jgi:pilus assembly protein CpaF